MDTIHRKSDKLTELQDQPIGFIFVVICIINRFKRYDYAIS